MSLTLSAHEEQALSAAKLRNKNETTKETTKKSALDLVVLYAKNRQAIRIKIVTETIWTPLFEIDF